MMSSCISFQSQSSSQTIKFYHRLRVCFQNFSNPIQNPVLPVFKIFSYRMGQKPISHCNPSILMRGGRKSFYYLIDPQCRPKVMRSQFSYVVFVRPSVQIYKISSTKPKFQFTVSDRYWWDCGS